MQSLGIVCTFINLTPASGFVHALKLTAFEAVYLMAEEDEAGHDKSGPEFRQKSKIPIKCGEIVTNNDVLRSIRHVLDLSDATIVDIFKLAEHKIDQASISNFLKEEDETGYLNCTDNLLILFLDGLISKRRGKSEQNPLQPKAILPPLTNNLIFKKLRIAFDLKEDDLIELMSLADYEVNKNELSAIFRKPGHKHYRECNDEFLMGFLIGLTFRQWN